MTMAPDYIVEVRDRDFTRLGQIAPEYLDLKLVEVFRGVGSWEMKLPSEHPLLADLKTKGSGIVITQLSTGRVFSGRTLGCKLSQDAEDPTGTWLISGADDNVIAAATVVLPDPLNAPDAQTAAYWSDSGAGENVMKRLVQYNAGSLAIVSRQYPWLTIAAGTTRGGTVSCSLRFDVLGEALTSLGVSANLGWRFYQFGTGVTFDVYEPADRTALIRLDIRNGGLESSELGWEAPGATNVLVLGQGEGADRTVLPVSTTESTAEATAWGLRWESAKDQRNTDDPVELLQAGEEVLAEQGQTVHSLAITPSDAPGQRLGEDWWLGDSVTVVIDGTPTVATVTQVATSISSAGVIRQATVGDPVGFDWEARVGAKLQQQDSRLNALETAVEAGVSWDGVAGKPLIFPTREPIAATGQAVTDANLAIDNGIYRIDSSVNTPLTTTLGIIVVLRGDSDASNILQEFRRGGTSSTIADDRIWTRVSQNGGATWTPWKLRGNAPRRGTAVQRAAAQSTYWEFWQDTDGDEGLYVGDKTGGWRRYSGAATNAAAAWSASYNGGGLNVLAGRTATLTIPTVLEVDEYLMVQATGVGTGFGFIGPVQITRNASSTELTLRVMQIMSLTTQAVSIAWHIVQE